MPFQQKVGVIRVSCCCGPCKLDAVMEIYKAAYFLLRDGRCPRVTRGGGKCFKGQPVVLNSLFFRELRLITCPPKMEWVKAAVIGTAE